MVYTLSFIPSAVLVVGSMSMQLWQHPESATSLHEAIGRFRLLSFSDRCCT